MNVSHCILTLIKLINKVTIIIIIAIPFHLLLASSIKLQKQVLSSKEIALYKYYKLHSIPHDI